jgi:hypothetical protein
MIIRTNVRKVTTETQLTRMDEYEISLVEISSHVGARPLCEPYQGKIYSLKGATDKYGDLYKDTSYGEPAGLFGINCGHQMFPYIEGTRKTYNPIPEKENNEAYKESQQQRALERNIRYGKRELASLEAQLPSPERDALINNTKKTIANRQERMRDFIKETDRVRRYGREQIY